MAKYTTCAVDVRGQSMSYIEFGVGGRTLVVLPGMSLHALLPSASSIAKRYRCFAEGYRVVVLDRMPGTMEGATVEGMASDAATALDALGVRDACVFGASQGGMMALVMAAERPDLVHALALGSSLGIPNEEASGVMREWVRLADSGDVVGLNRNIFGHVYSPAFQEKFKNALSVLESQGTAEELVRYANLARASLRFDFSDRLDRISCPVLVVGAECDRVLTAAASIRLAQALGCQLHMYEGASHAAYDEVAGYAERLRRFFDLT